MTGQMEFNKEKASSYLKVSKEFISDIEISQREDIVYGELMIKIDALFYAALADKKILSYLCKRPTFFDWLLRREREIKWEFKVKDVLLNPPKHPDKTVRLYFYDQIS
jgi:hypothetical protein